MSATTEISWTDATWNMWPGCLPSSPACANCWARYPGWRMAYNPNPKVSAPYQGIIKKVLADGTEIIGGEEHERRSEKGTLKFTGLTRFIPERLELPLRWRAPKRIFVCSNSDLFLPSRVDTEGGRRQIAAVFGVMAACPQHCFQVLTKWPGKAREWFDWLEKDAADQGMVPAVHSRIGEAIHRSYCEVEGLPARVHMTANGTFPAWPLPNVHFGVTVEDQQRADERIPELLSVPAAVRWLSVEPMLGPIDLSRSAPPEFFGLSAVTERAVGGRAPMSIDWIVLGGESGSGARPMHPDWARSIRDQCVEAGVPLHFKQFGAWTFEQTPTRWNAGGPLPDMFEDSVDGILWATTVSSTEPKRVGERIPYILHEGMAHRGYRVGKKAAGRVLDGRTWDEFPSSPQGPR